MAMSPKELRDFQLAIYLETNRSVDLGRLAAFLTALAEFAEERLGPDANFELTNLSTGSVTAMFTAWGTVIGGLGGFGSFAVALAMYIQNNRQRRISRRAAELVIDDDVVTISLETNNTERIIIQGQSVAAVELAIAQRDAQTGSADRDQAWSENYGGSSRHLSRGIEDALPAADYRITEDRFPLLTEDGDRIEEEGGAIEMSPDYEEFFDAMRRNPRPYNENSQSFGVFVGRIKLADSKRYFITQSGRNFRLVGIDPNAEYPPNQTYVVRGPVLKDAAGSHDWLEAKDLFVPDE